MKMKWWIILPLALVVLAIAGGVALYNWNHEPQLKGPALLDSLPPLPDEAPAARAELQRVRKTLGRLSPNGRYIVIDTNANYLYLRTADSVIFKATCSTGSGGELVDSASGRRWTFRTPQGVFKVDSKLVDPWWRKPDWAFYEEGEKPPKDASERFDPNMLGEYALGFGNGYFIHGTLYERLLGINVTHGCVRVGDKDLKEVFDVVTMGSKIYIY